MGRRLGAWGVGRRAQGHVFASLISRFSLSNTQLLFLPTHPIKYNESKVLSSDSTICSQSTIVAQLEPSILFGLVRQQDVSPDSQASADSLPSGQLCGELAMSMTSVSSCECLCTIQRQKSMVSDSRTAFGSSLSTNVWDIGGKTGTR
jgi:hypothetical protein